MSALPVVRESDSPFSYQCNSCCRCCYGRRIQVNPYELARLARNLGITTTDVIARFTISDGTALQSRADSACVFLGPAGCTVHSDRPLVCRLYPLGRIVREDGSAIFIDQAPHPQTEGVYGEDGTVRAFLESQGVAPYLAASDRYYALYRRLMTPDSSAGDHGSAPDVRSGDGEATIADIDPRAFIDADLALQLDAGEAAFAPMDAAELMERHIAIIERWLNG